MIRTVMAVIGTAASIPLFGLPILMGLVGLWMAPQRGREKATGYAWGVWLGPFYLAYLLFQPRVEVAASN